MQVQVNSYQDIGAYLREVRESLGYHTRDIAHQLNIRAKYLVALEEGAIEVMPGKVYARGYLQNYAEYLGLDKEEIAEAFDRMGEGGKVRYFVPEPTGHNYQPGMTIVGLALVIVASVYYFWYQNHEAPVPRDYEMVSPVPERLLDPIIEEPEAQENDDLFVNPTEPQDNTRQRDSDAELQMGPPAPEPPAPETAKQPEAAVVTPAPAPAPQKQTKKQTQSQKTTRKLPWLQNQEAQ